MKLLIAFAFFMSSLLGTSSACAHAIGNVSEATVTTHSTNAHDHHMHHDQNHEQVHTTHEMHTNSHQDCPDDCDGGPDCAGCSAIQASVTVDELNFDMPFINAQYSTNDEVGFEKSYALEPPPPRTI